MNIRAPWRKLWQNTRVRRMMACGSLAALLLASVYAPLFHVHAEPGEAPVVHAHFPDLEISDIERGVHMEAHHSHSEARSIDILTTTAASITHFDAIILSAFISPNATQLCWGFIPLAIPRAHAPPAIAPHIPRAPPA